MNRTDFRLSHRLRVRWVEVDIQKVVFNGHYLMYFDNAISDYWRALALPYEETMHQLEGDLYVKKALLEYHESAELDDWLDVCMKCVHLGNSSMKFAAAIYRGDRLLVSGEMIYVYADPRVRQSKSIPDKLREVITSYEAGDEMIHLQIGTWKDLNALASPLRRQVFVNEQNVSEDLEWDEFDLQAQHVVAVNKLGHALATGRWYEQSQGVARIGRMAVSKVMRGSGLGEQVLHKLIDLAKNAKCHQAILHAQCNATHFYAQSGFIPKGEVFSEAGIDHIEMVLNIG
jgi:YbgC/YbaW family acyl-CoA thioester hydrolase